MEKARYKLMAVDMDGTLLKSDGTISQTTEAAVKKAVAGGLVFVLCTGRPLQGVQRYIGQLGLSGPVITYNGAVIADSGSGEILFSQDMDADDARAVWRAAVRKNTFVVVWSQNRLYVSEIGEKSAFYEEIARTKASLITDFEALADRGITKMLWYDDPAALDAWQGEFADLRQTTAAKSRAYFLEFFSSKVSKAVAMQHLGQRLGISREEMIAVGDQVNDLPMIAYAGLGVAMGNAMDAVKAAAGYVTDDNDHEGVAKVIAEFI